MGKISEFIGNLVSPINKLIDLIGRACGKIYEPIHIRRMAKAISYARKQQGPIEISPAYSANNNVMHFLEIHLHIMQDNPINSITIIIFYYLRI